MKLFLAIAAALMPAAALAHESFIPHHHPHGMSWLPDADMFGPAVLVLALAIIACAQFRRR